MLRNLFTGCASHMLLDVATTEVKLEVIKSIVPCFKAALHNDKVANHGRMLHLMTQLLQTRTVSNKLDVGTL